MCKKVIKTFLLFSLVLCFSSCSSSGKSIGNAEKVGRYTFDFLEQINVLETADLIQFFAPTKTIQKFLSETITEDQRNHSLYTLIENDEAEWPKYLYEVIYSVKNDGAKMGIEWNKVTYLDFISRLNAKDNLHKGELFFKYDKNVYSVTTTSVSVGKKAYLIALANLRRVSK